MMHMILWEYKRLFHKKTIWILFIIVIAFGFLFANNDSNQPLTNRNQEFNNIQHKYAGIADEHWLAKVEKDYKQADIDDLLKVADNVKMEEQYGANWKKDYLTNTNQYEMVLNDKNEQDKLENGKKAFYVTEYADSQISRALLSMIDYGDYTTKKPWRFESSAIAFDEAGNEHQAKNMYGRDMDKEENAWINKQLNAIENFYFDNHQGWDSLLAGMSSGRFFLAIFIVFATSRIFNEDHNYYMMDNVKTTKYGKQKAVYAKLTALMIFTTLITALYALLLTLGIFLLSGLGNWNVNLAAIFNYPNMYTIKEAYLGGISYLWIGCMSIGFLSATISLFIKRSYLSLILAFMAFIIPNQFTGSLSILAPVNYMDFSDTFFYMNPFHLFNNYSELPSILYCFTAVLIGICFIISISYYRSYRISHS